jgi:hypothetical protein
MELSEEIKRNIEKLKEMQKIEQPQLVVQIAMHHIKEFLSSKNVKWQEI